MLSNTPEGPKKKTVLTKIPVHSQGKKFLCLENQTKPIVFLKTCPSWRQNKKVCNFVLVFRKTIFSQWNNCGGKRKELLKKGKKKKEGKL